MAKRNNKSSYADYKKHAISDLVLTLRCIESANLALNSAPLYVTESDTLEDRIPELVLRAEHLIYDENYPATDNQKAYITMLRKLYTR